MRRHRGRAGAAASASIHVPSERSSVVVPRQRLPLLAQPGSALLRPRSLLSRSRTPDTKPLAGAHSLDRRGQGKETAGEIGQEEAQPLSSSFLQRGLRCLLLLPSIAFFFF